MGSGGFEGQEWCGEGPYKDKELQGDVKVAIEHLHHRIDGLDGQVKSLKHQVDEVRNQVDGRSKGLEGRFTNMGAREPWDDIVQVEYKNQAGKHISGDGAPNNHPDKVAKL